MYRWLSLMLVRCAWRYQAQTLAAPIDITEWEVPWADTRPRDPFVTPDGGVWFVGQKGHYLARLDPKSGDFERFDLEAGAGPHNLIVADDGAVWFAGNRKACIGKLDPETKEITKFPMPDPVAREPTCHSCHFENPIDEEAGFLVLAGVPDLYSPGATYRLEIALQRPGLEQGGFQLAAGFSTGELQGRQAGRFEPLDNRTQMPEPKENQIQYLQHSSVGSTPSGVDTLTWAVRWLSPTESAAPVVLHLVANAANDDDSQFGDFVYTKGHVSRGAR